MALQAANDQLAAMGARTRMSHVEWLTRTDTGQVGQTVFFSSRGNKQLSADFVPGPHGVDHRGRSQRSAAYYRGC